MPAARQFDPDAALDAAMRQFWAHGYRGTSLSRLVEVMGVNRASLYATFGDKRALFLAALHRYDDRCRRALLEELERTRPAKAAIRELFERWLAVSRTPAGVNGCLLTNTATELHGDEELRALVAGSQRDTERWLRRLVRRGQAEGEVPTTLDAGAAARRMLGALIGMLVLMRSRPEPALLRGIARQSTAMLDGAPTVAPDRA